MATDSSSVTAHMVTEDRGTSGPMLVRMRRETFPCCSFDVRLSMSMCLGLEHLLSIMLRSEFQRFLLIHMVSEQ